MKIKTKKTVALLVSLVFSLQVNANEISNEITELDKTTLNENLQDDIIDTNNLEEEYILENTIEEENIAPNISAKSSVLMDMNTGAIIFEKDKDKKSYPASTTKIMTALLVMEASNFNMNDTIYFSEDAIYKMPAGSSHISMDVGESITVEQALNALLIASANEVANALAEYVSGDIDIFAQKMTERAKELGALNTNFVNAHGFYDSNHYTTAYDMSLIMAEALKHEEFLEIINKQRYTIPPTEKQSEQRFLNNSNKMILPGEFNYEYSMGGKTGYTDEAGHTLVSYAQKEGIDLLAVVLEDQKNLIFEDSKKLFEFGFADFEDVMILDKDNYKNQVEVKENINGEELDLGFSDLYIENSIYINIPSMIKNEIVIKDNTDKTILGAIKKGQEVGSLDLMYKDNILGTFSVFSKDNVESIDIPIESDLKTNTAKEENTSLNDSIDDVKKNDEINNILDKFNILDKIKTKDIFIYSLFSIIVVIGLFIIKNLFIFDTPQHKKNRKITNGYDLNEMQIKNIDKKNYRYKTK